MMKFRRNAPHTLSLYLLILFIMLMKSCLSIELESKVFTYWCMRIFGRQTPYVINDSLRKLAHALYRDFLALKIENF